MIYSFKIWHVDAAMRVYKTLQATPFPINELAVIPWVSKYQEYIYRVNSEDNAFKVAQQTNTCVLHVFVSGQYTDQHTNFLYSRDNICQPDPTTTGECRWGQCYSYQEVGECGIIPQASPLAY